MVKHHGRLLAVCLFLIVLLGAFEISGIRGHVNLAFLQQRIQENQYSGLAVFALLFTLGNFIQIPGWIFLAAAVLTLGKISGGMATYLAALVSCSVTFLVIRLLGGDALRRLDNGIARRLLQQLDNSPIRIVILLRVFFQTLPAINYALAMSGVSFRKYLAGTLIGLPLPIALYCLFFDYLAKVAGVR